MSKSRLCLMLLPIAVACPAGLEPPEALIRAGNSHDDKSACEETTSTVRVPLGEVAAIHGACSRDPNGLDLTYRWQLVDQPSGSLLAVPNETVISPTVVPDVAGRYRLALIVSNGTLTSPRTYVTLDAQP